MLVLELSPYQLHVMVCFPVDPEVFPRRPVNTKGSKDSEPSMLAVMLAEHNILSANPFFKYSKFNGEVSHSLSLRASTSPRTVFIHCLVFPLPHLLIFRFCHCHPSTCPHSPSPPSVPLPSPIILLPHFDI